VAIMRKPPRFTLCLVLAACAWMLAPGVPVRAGDEAAGEPQEQWRIFPNPPFARSANEEITGRLTRQIDRFAEVYRPDSSARSLETLGDSLVDSKARIQLFRLESLLRLYVKPFPDLEKYRLEVKDIEDGLGDYTFAVDSLDFAKDRFKDENKSRAPDAARKAEQDRILAGLEKRKAAARVVFARLVERSTLDDDLPQLRSAVMSSFAGWNGSKDRQFVSHELLKALRKVRDGRFNFNLLEDGIHEFRRQLRWFPILVDSFDGLILVRDDPPGSCPVPALEKLAGTSTAKHRYSNPELKFPASRPCTISRCLLWQVVKTTNDIGKLKDEVQGNASVESALLDNDIDVSASNKATPEEIARGKAYRDELYSSHALDSLMSQLSSCKS
jgi:hypothetical protein